MSSMWLTTDGTIPAHFRGIQTADHRTLVAMPVYSEELHLRCPKIPPQFTHFIVLGL